MPTRSTVTEHILRPGFISLSFAGSVTTLRDGGWEGFLLLWGVLLLVLWVAPVPRLLIGYVRSRGTSGSA